MITQSLTSLQGKVLLFYWWGQFIVSLYREQSILHLRGFWIDQSPSKVQMKYISNRFNLLCFHSQSWSICFIVEFVYDLVWLKLNKQNPAVRLNLHHLNQTMGIHPSQAEK